MGRIKNRERCEQKDVMDWRERDGMKTDDNVAAEKRDR